MRLEKETVSDFYKNIFMYPFHCCPLKVVDDYYKV